MMEVRGKEKNRGAALLLVIAIIAFLTVAVVEFQREARLELSYAGNSLASLEAQALVRSGLAAGVSMLNASSTSSVSRADVWLAEEGYVLPVGQSSVLVRIEDAYGKYPIGALIDNKGKDVSKVIQGYERLLTELNIPDADPKELTWALVDWIDDDSAGDTYEFNENYTIPDTVPIHLDELGRITGYDKLPRFYLDQILSQLDTRSDPKINVNTAPVPVLMALSPTLDHDGAVTAYDTLTSTPATSVAGVNAQIPTAGRAMQAHFSSTRLKVYLEAEVREVRAKAEAIVEKNASGVFQVVDWVQL